MSRKIYIFFIIILLSVSGFACSGHRLAGHSIKEFFQDENVVELIEFALWHEENRVRDKVSLGVDINSIGESGFTPLLWAILDRDPQAVEILLKMGANPNLYVAIPNGTNGLAPPVFVASSAGESKILTLLLEHGGNPNSVHNTISALMQTLKIPDYSCAEILLEHGADINYANRGSEYTALHLALGFNDYERAMWVLQHGYTRRMDLVQREVKKMTSKTRIGQEPIKEKITQFVADYLYQHPSQ